jgi:hypothetical protein
MTEVESEVNPPIDNSLDFSAECKTVEYHDNARKTTVIIEPLQ